MDNATTQIKLTNTRADASPTAMLFLRSILVCYDIRAYSINRTSPSANRSGTDSIRRLSLESIVELRKMMVLAGRTVDGHHLTVLTDWRRFLKQTHFTEVRARR